MNGWRVVNDNSDADQKRRVQNWLDDGNEPTIVPYIPVSWEQLKLNKKTEIKSAYKETLICTPVKTIKDLTVKGGSLHLEMFRSVEYILTNTEETEYYIIDYEGDYHSINLAEIKQVIIDVILDGNNNIMKESILLSEIESLIDDTPENREALNNINW